MPFKGTCAFCNEGFEAETRAGFGNALIEHHNNNGCDTFICFEFEGQKVIGSPFGLEVTKEIVSNSLTGELWYQKGRGIERG
ncbi:MAG: hypothetical protein NTZ07_04170 [Candidatus Woesebacteria bacterium]|nr:hypothetical protein [Candidatus Woesebacteria bacterium]